MFNVSFQGLYCMDQFLKETKEAEGKVVRLHFEEGELFLGPGEAGENDKVFEFQGKPVLLVSNDIAEKLEGRTLDAKPDMDTGHMEIFLTEVAN